jgi:aspartate/methionine/tyrosine aminotransferase
VRACLQVKIAAVRLNTNRLAQVGAAAALRDAAWLARGEEVIRRNLSALREVATPVVDPAYGFSCVVDVTGLGASAQELTVALCKRRVAVYPGDGLGEVGATTTIRLNLSDPDPAALARFAAALPDAAEEAANGAYRDAVRDLFLSYGTERGRRLAALL